jgi:uncharacterized protein
MSGNDLEQTIRFILKHTADHRLNKQQININFNGGEAFLNYPVLKSFYDRLSAEGYRNFVISTNLTLADDAILDWCYHNRIHLHISIDGEKEVHDRNRIDHDGKGSFDRVIERIRFIRKHYPDWNNSYNITLTPEETGLFDKSYAFLRDLGIRTITAATSIDGVWDDKAVEGFRKSMKSIADSYMDDLKQGVDRSFKLLDLSMSCLIHGKPSNCGACVSEMAILPGGEILPCAVFTGLPDYERFVMGTVSGYLDGERLVKVIDQCLIKNDECRECDLDPFCYRVCYGSSQRVGGNVYATPDAICHINQISIEEGQRMIDELYQSQNEIFIRRFSLEGHTSRISVPC